MAPEIETLPAASRTLNIAVCAPQVPFVTGGAEQQVAALCRELRLRGHNAELVTIPYKWYPRVQLHHSIAQWELADLSESDGRPIDMVIATKFPSYFVRHRRQVLWLIHQFRQIYDLYGSEHSDYSPKRWRDRRFRRCFVERDTAALARFSRRFTDSETARERLQRFNGLDAETLHHPPRLADRLHFLEYGDFVLSVGRLDRLKRVDGLLHAMTRTQTGIKAMIAGDGSEMGGLQKLAHELGVAHRVEFLGYVNDERLIELYARCLCVYFAPVDEDYGYITLEAFLSRKPVITCSDSGATLEFVVHERNGFVLPPGDPAAAAGYLDGLFRDRELCGRLGSAGRQAVEVINWDYVISRLLGESA